MYKASVVGIDNSGKSSAVSALEGIDGIGTIHTFSDYNGGKSRLARISGRLANRLAHFGEGHEYKKLTGFAYLLHLAPYLMEQRAKGSYSILVSDRDPIFDTLYNSEFYLPKGFTDKINPALRLTLRLFFSNPNLFIYLETSPEVSMKRSNEQKQLHEDLDTLTKIRELFDREVFALERNGTSVVRIDTDAKTLEEVTEEVKYTLGTKSGITII